MTDDYPDHLEISDIAYRQLSQSVASNQKSKRDSWRSTGKMKNKILPSDWKLLWLVVWLSHLTGKIVGHGVNDNLAFRVVKPTSREIAYDYQIRPARNFGGRFNFYYNQIPLVAADPLEACGELHNSDEIRGAVALVRRGECSFLSKSIVADRAGAVLVVIYDNDEKNDGRFIDMIDDETNRMTSIPSAFMLGRDGKVIEHFLLEHEGPIEIAIPVNVTGIPYSHLHRPPWTLW